LEEFLVGLQDGGPSQVLGLRMRVDQDHASRLPDPGDLPGPVAVQVTGTTAQMKGDFKGEGDRQFHEIPDPVRGGQAAAAGPPARGEDVHVRNTGIVLKCPLEGGEEGLGAKIAGGPEPAHGVPLP